MSSLSDHVQLMKSQETKYDSVLTNENGYILTIQPPNTTKELPSLRQPVYQITPNF